MAENVYHLIRGKTAKALGEPSPGVDEPTFGSGPRGPEDGDMVFGERLGRLEEAIIGLRHGQNLHLAALGGSFAVMLGGLALVVGLVFILMTKLDQQGDKLEKLTERTIELPGKVAAELRDIAKTLADSITAAKQTPPQVILMPAPQLPPTPPQPTPAPKQ